MAWARKKTSRRGKGGEAAREGDDDDDDDVRWGIGGMHQGERGGVEPSSMRDHCVRTRQMSKVVVMLSSEIAMRAERFELPTF